MSLMLISSVAPKSEFFLAPGQFSVHCYPMGECSFAEALALPPEVRCKEAPYSLIQIQDFRNPVHGNHSANLSFFVFLNMAPSFYSFTFVTFFSQRSFI